MSEHRFPTDLLDIQRAFFAAERRAAEAEGEAFSKAVQEQQELALAKNRHRMWATVPFADRYKVDMALREASRTADSPTE